MYRMFAETPLMVILVIITINGDISKWDVSKVKGITDMFGKSPLKNKPEFQPTFK